MAFDLAEWVRPDWVSVAVAIAVFVVLMTRRNAPPDLLFLGGLVTVTLLGAITPAQALEGFSNPAVLIIGALFVAAAALRHTGVLDWVGHRLLGTAHTEGAALARLAATVVTGSAFIINTPVVVMFLPVVVDWCRRRRISPSRLLIPLSYLAILGGVCTLIGTSTTLVVNGLLETAHRDAVVDLDAAIKSGSLSESELDWQRRRTDALRTLGLFEIGRVGLPCAIVGTLYLLLFSRRLLPNRSELIEKLGEQRREYLLEMLVMPECRLIGQTVEAAGLRHLPGLFLIEIDRHGDTITPVTPDDVIHPHDRLIFTGVVSTIVDLEKIPGLVPAADMTYEVRPSVRQSRHLTEAVISNSSPLVGRTAREINFRRLYNAAVVAVHRNGQRLTNKVGDTRLQPGDTLLLQTRAEFTQSHRNNRDFYLVSAVEGSQPRRHDRAWVATLLFLLLVVWMVAAGWLKSISGLSGFGSRPVAAIAVAGLMIAARCVSIGEARSVIDMRVLLTIVGALGLGKALTESGAASSIATFLVNQVGAGQPMLLLIIVYLVATIFTEMITNNAVAAMLFPLAVAVASAARVDPRPFVMAIALAASLAFLTPIGYQTNLIVMGPGGYRPTDFLRIGGPLAALVAITSLLLIPQMWPF